MTEQFHARIYTLEKLTHLHEETHTSLLVTVLSVVAKTENNLIIHQKEI